VTPHRVALYWAPERDDPLHALGSRWLGRDAQSGEALDQPVLSGLDIAEITADARGYALHATLKPPFRIATDYSAVCADATALAARTSPFALPSLSPMPAWPRWTRIARRRPRSRSRAAAPIG